jgi:membrane protein YqaA with SNARE-associated domain
MIRDLLTTFGPYGGSFLVALIAGLFPLISIEVALLMLSYFTTPTWPVLLACCGLAAVGHQIAKTITYYAGVGALERGKLKKKLDEVRPRIEKWNKAPKLVMFLGGSLGLPPLYVLGFIARPLMGMGIVPFTLIVLFTRFGRFVVVGAVPLLL